MRLSILVVSRTPKLLGTMLSSLMTATKLEGKQVEVLCSWNGSLADESEIENASGYELLIAQRDPYHFAGNMNALAKKANGDTLLIINDDVILDDGSIDAGLECLDNNDSAGLVGGRLRNHQGELIHAGILFDSRHSPYHQLDRLSSAEHAAVLGNDRTIPAVTGALMLIKRENFNALTFNTTYNVCGEDVELCLDIRQKLGLSVYYVPKFSGVHESESTRSQQPDQSANDSDLVRMRARRRDFLETAGHQQLTQELNASVAEAEALRDIEVERLKAARDTPPNPSLQDELQHWRSQAHSLQLERLRLQQALQQALQQRGS